MTTEEFSAVAERVETYRDVCGRQQEWRDVVKRMSLEHGNHIVGQVVLFLEKQAGVKSYDVAESVVIAIGKHAAAQIETCEKALAAL
jgi:hypothetical protein